LKALLVADRETCFTFAAEAAAILDVREVALDTSAERAELRLQLRVVPDVQTCLVGYPTDERRGQMKTLASHVRRLAAVAGFAAVAALAMTASTSAGAAHRFDSTSCVTNQAWTTCLELSGITVENGTSRGHEILVTNNHATWTTMYAGAVVAVDAQNYHYNAHFFDGFTLYPDVQHELTIDRAVLPNGTTCSVRVNLMYHDGSLVHSIRFNDCAT
jgi:hypothetical protein